ncbi:MAG: SOS response-associated peptidase family protein [Balneolaceae bacterium]
MSNRIAFFADSGDLKEQFGLSETGDAIFEAHYNIARGHHIPVISGSSDSYKIGRARWGSDFEQDAEIPGVQDKKGLNELSKKADKRVIIPLSGFYIWKREGKEDHPFFVRKIDNTLLYSAGFSFKDEKNDFTYVEILMMESNTLIRPITDEMPLIIKAGLAKKWLNGGVDAAELVKEANNQFLITDLTVHRVSKELNDLSKNDASLIQPIPK